MSIISTGPSNLSVKTTPNDLLLRAARWDNIFAKQSETEVNDSQSLTFATHAPANHSGVQQPGSWIQLCDIVDAGGIFAGIVGKYCAGPHTATFEITVDGIVYTLTHYVDWQDSCAVLGGIHGAFTKYLNPPFADYVKQTEAGIGLLGSQADAGYDYKNSVYFPNPLMSYSYRIPTVKFNSLKVRTKYDTVTVNSRSSAHFILFDTLEHGG